MEYSYSDVLTGGLRSPDPPRNIMIFQLTVLIFFEVQKFLTGSIQNRSRMNFFKKCEFVFPNVFNIIITYIRLIL